MSRKRSAEAFARAKQLIPGGVNSPARAFGAVGGEPLFIERGEGAYLYDVDGNRYIDYIGSWGPLILGHRHPKVVEALEDALHRGTSFGAPTEAESELAQLVIDAVPSLQRVRMVNSGTEATMSALRLARGFTGRERIIKFAGNYHGHVDSLLVAAGSSAATLSVPDSPGVTSGTAKDTIILRYNDVDALTEAFKGEGDGIAGVIVEPVVGNMGCVPATMEFLRALRELTSRYGALLIFDEVMTGFRVAYGGAQQRYGVMPDLTALGKIVGGGLPVGAYGGRAEIMDRVLPAGPVFQAGTLSGNPLAMAAGVATLTVLRETRPYEDLERKGTGLAAALHEAAEEAGVPHSVGQVGSMLTLFFNPETVVNWDIASRTDTKKYARYFWGMIERGVYMPCSQYEALFISTAHSDEDLAATAAAAREVLAELS